MSVHPDDEALSAHLDGEAPEWESHVRSCPPCQARLAAFGRVAAAVGTAREAAAPGTGDEAVARAVAAATTSSSSVWKSRRLVTAAAGIAAAVLVAGGVVALVHRGASRSSSTASRALGPVAANVVEAGDLGDLADDKALKAQVEPSLSTTEAAPAAGAAGAAASKAPAQTGAKSEALRSSSARPLPCEAQARALQPGTQVLVYRAAARWQGTLAVVFGFTAAGPTPTRSAGALSPTRVYVMARSGCGLLHFQSYAP
jgi:hypothetical protein